MQVSPIDFCPFDPVPDHVELRIRRVKCDEAKPKCVKCQRFGVKCDGYEAQKASIVPGRKVLPKVFLLPQYDGPPLRYQPLAPMFKNDLDYQCFAHFRDHTSCVMSGGFDSSLWSRVVLQACEAEPPLRHLTISLGALNMKNADDAASLHWTYARTQYGKALKAIRESLASRSASDSAHIALVAALLIFCFENQFGDPALALAHIESALALLRKQLPTTRRRSYRHLRKVSPTADLEFDLVSAFARLDNYILARYENVGPTRTYILDMSYYPEEFDVPETFNNITTARNYLEHFQFRAFPSVPHEFLVDIQKNPQTLGDYFEGQNVLPSQSFQQLSAQLGQWNKAFRPLFERSRTPEGSKDFLPATILRIQSVSVDSILRATHFSGSPCKDENISHQAREIISLTRRAIAHPDFRKTFVFDVGIIPSLACVFMTSHERSIGEEVVRIAREMIPRREGVWDSLTVVEIGERILKENRSSVVE